MGTRCPSQTAPLHRLYQWERPPREIIFLETTGIAITGSLRYSVNPASMSRVQSHQREQDRTMPYHAHCKDRTQTSPNGWISYLFPKTKDLTPFWSHRLNRPSPRCDVPLPMYTTTTPCVLYLFADVIHLKYRELCSVRHSSP